MHCYKKRLYEKLTYPEIKQFIHAYAGSGQPLPLEQVLNFAGVNYKSQTETKDSTFSLGRVSLGFNAATGHIIVNDTSRINALGRALGYIVGDEIISVNDEIISSSNAQ